MMQETETTVLLKHTMPIERQQPATRVWYQQMDGLRFIAVTAVLIEHFAHYIGGPLRMAFFGVDLFFVISGFLITEGLLIDSKVNSPGKAIRKFYLKRFLRIFPIYYLVLFLALFFYPPFREVAVWAFTYSINYYKAITGNWIVEPFGHLWSLSVEEQFYVFWPFVVLFTPRKYLFTILSLIFLSSLTYFILKHDWWGLPGRMYSLCLGAYLAFFKTKKPGLYRANIHNRFLGIFALALILFFVDPALGLSTFSLGLVYLGSNNGFRGLIRRLLENKRVLYIGKISYGVYLYHIPIGFMISIYIFDPIWQGIDFGSLGFLKFNSWIIKFPLYSLISILVAHVSYKIIELPLLRLKDKIR